MEINSVALRATKDLGDGGFVLFASSRGIDAKALAADHDALFKWLQTVIEREDLTFEKVYWVSEFRCELPSFSEQVCVWTVTMQTKYSDG